MGHSGLSGCSLNRSSSNNSTKRFLHTFLCLGRCATWQSRLQYLTILQAVHLLSLMSSDSALLQLAQTVSSVMMYVRAEVVIVKRNKVVPLPTQGSTFKTSKKIHCEINSSLLKSKNLIIVSDR